jgi:hypothetical protein
MLRPPFLRTSSEVFKHPYQILFILSKKHVNSQCPSSLSRVCKGSVTKHFRPHQYRKLCHIRNRDRLVSIVMDHKLDNRGSSSGRGVMIALWEHTTACKVHSKVYAFNTKTLSFQLQMRQDSNFFTNLHLVSRLIICRESPPPPASQYVLRRRRGCGA